MLRAPTDQPALASRRHERAECRIGATALPVAGVDGSISLSPSRSRPDGSVEVTIVDVSLGGMSVLSDVFLPRGCVLEVRVSPGPDAAPSVRLRGQVRNVAMIDRTPRYKLGLRLLGEGGERAEAVESLQAMGGVGGGTDAGS